MSKLNELFVIEDENIIKIREYFGKSEANIKRDVKLLQEWLKQQPHLPHDEDDYFLETLLIANKCRIEKTKMKLENLYTFRSLYPDIMEYYDLDNEPFRNAFDTFIIFVLPNLTPNLERCVYIRIKRPELFIVRHLYGLTMVVDFLRNKDYSLSFIFIFDWNGATFDVVKQLDVTVLQRLYNVLMNALSGKFTHVILLNMPVFGDIALKMLKLICKPELYKRIKSYQHIESVYEIIPREMLPLDYGGNGKSVDELERAVREEIKYHKDFFKKVASKKSNEKLRIEPIKYNELFGTDGTFKKLNLD